MERLSPQGKTAVITGAGSGIGRATAVRLAREGFDLALCARRLDKLQQTEEQVSRYGVKTLILQGDLTDDDYRFSFIWRAADFFGGVDILIDNAGMALNCSFEETDVTDFDKIMRLNVRSTYFASKHAVHGLSKSLAKEVYKDGIRCHVISPGGVYTDMVKVARPDLSPEGMISPQEVAEAAAFFICHRGNAVIDEMRLHRIGKEPFG